MISDVEKQTETTLFHHLQATGVDDILSDYTEDSVLFTSNGPVRGLAGLRVFFEAFIKSATPEMMAAYQLIRHDVGGEIAYIVWKAEPFVPLASDTFVVRDGKIVAQTFVAYMPS
jgi:ketosteroid isomerase-like protein